MIYTAIFQNAENGEFSRSVVFDASYSKQEAWEAATNMQHPVEPRERSPQSLAGVDGDYLFCLVKGSQEVWHPDTE